MKGNFNHIQCTVEPLLRGHPDKRPTPLERPHHNTNLNLYVLMSTPYMEELVWRSGSVMDCHATTRGSIPGGVFTELHILRKGQ